MSSASAGAWQAVYRWSGGMWRPPRGTYSGLRCADCGAIPSTLYRKGSSQDTDDANYYCEEHKP